ncbi:MAG: class I SAM-dependent methyltransferase [Euryarchaeota archaeon]|nr:class I SAM-dependent methyltransferase [Euryarchaeota archaeon]
MTTFPEFLTAKRTVEDRALNRRVWEQFVTELAERAGGSDPVRIVEIGSGTGSMIARLADWEALPPTVSYRAVDLDAETVDSARKRLPERLRAAGYTVDEQSDPIRARRTDSDGTERTIEIGLETGDGFAIDDAADAVIAAAVLDLVDLQPAVEDLKRALGDNGLLYAPVTFNGHTSFIPRDPLDDRIERLYHRHMDEVRAQPGSSRAGQQLLKELPAAGYTVLEAGGADWIVRPTDSAYLAAESTVLEHLLETIDGALADYPADVIEPETGADWIERRRGQLERGELTLVAHHLDVLARL